MTGRSSSKSSCAPTHVRRVGSVPSLDRRFCLFVSEMVHAVISNNTTAQGTSARQAACDVLVLEASPFTGHLQQMLVAPVPETLPLSTDGTVTWHSPTVLMANVAAMAVGDPVGSVVCLHPDPAAYAVALASPEDSVPQYTCTMCQAKLPRLPFGRNFYLRWSSGPSSLAGGWRLHTYCMATVGKTRPKIGRFSARGMQ